MGMSYTAEQKQAIIAAYQAGNAIKQVAKLLGHGKRSVNTVLQEAGVLRTIRTTKATEEAICKDYEVGISQLALSKKYGIQRHTIRRILDRNNVARVPWEGVRLNEDQQKELIAMWRDSLPAREIERHFGISTTTLHRYLRQLNEPRRRPHWHSFGPKHGRWTGGRKFWKGGKTTNGQGYTMIWVGPDDPYASMRNLMNYVPEHRLVMARHLGRPLTKQETVHHINGNAQDNRLENLQLRVGQHGKGQAYCCADCGSYNVVPVELGD